MHIIGEIDYEWDLHSILSELLETVSFNSEESSLSCLESNLYKAGKNWYIKKKCRLEKKVDEKTVIKALRRELKSVVIADFGISPKNEQRIECEFFGAEIGAVDNF